MRRWAIRLAVLGAGIGVSAASAPTLSAWVDTTSTPSGTLSAIPDWTPPVIHRAVIQKAEGGKPDHVRVGGQYRLCARVATADTGNPASGLPANWLTASITSLTNAIPTLGLVLPGPCAASDNRADGLNRIVAAGPASRQVTLTARDNDNNVATHTIDVTVDGTRPTASSFTTVNKVGGTAGLVENGDKAIFTYSEPIDPHSIQSGWDGSETDVTAGVVNSTTGNLDYFGVYRFNTTTQLPLTGAAGVGLRADYVSNTYIAMPSKMVAVGNTIEIRLGTPAPLDTAAVANVAGNRNPTSWTLVGTPYDWAGNTLSSTAAVAEGDSTDVEF